MRTCGDGRMCECLVPKLAAKLVPKLAAKLVSKLAAFLCNLRAGGGGGGGGVKVSNDLNYIVDFR